MTEMSELTQAERIAALKAKRAANGSATPKPIIAESVPLHPPAIPTFADPSTEAMAAAPTPGLGLQMADPATPAARVATVREARSISIRLPRPAPQRVAAAGVSIVSFAAITVAMGPLTTQTVETAAADESPETVPDTDLATTVAPPAAPEVLVEVIPNYVAVAPDGTPLPDVTLLPDGTLAEAETGETSLAADGTETTTTALEGSTTVAPSTAAAAATAAPATAVPTTAAPKAAAAPKTTAAPATAAPTTAVQPAPTAAPATAAPTTAPPATAAPTTAPTTAAPQPPPPTTAPPATTAPPPPKSDASG